MRPQIRANRTTFQKSFPLSVILYDPWIHTASTQQCIFFWNATGCTSNSLNMCYVMERSHTSDGGQSWKSEWTNVRMWGELSGNTGLMRQYKRLEWQHLPAPHLQQLNYQETSYCHNLIQFKWFTNNRGARSKHAVCKVLQHCGASAVPRELMVAEGVNAHHGCFGLLVSPASLSPWATSPPAILRAYVNAGLNYTLGVGHKIQRGVRFAAIHFSQSQVLVENKIIFIFLFFWKLQSNGMAK